MGTRRQPKSDHCEVGRLQAVPCYSESIVCNAKEQPFLSHILFYMPRSLDTNTLYTHIGLTRITRIFWFGHI